jgi:hypothetical protein
MAMDDSFLRTRPKSTLPSGPATAALARQTVVELHGEAEPHLPTMDDFPLLPQFGSPYDAAYSRAENKPMATLRFIIGDSIRGFPYSNYDSIDWQAPDKPGASPSIVIRFTGLIAREAIIAGRHLLKLYDLLSHHRVAWVRELPKGKDFMDAKATVITSITINRIAEMPA